MDFIQKLIYYCLLFGTAVLSMFYIYEAFFKRNVGVNVPYMKECFGVASIFVLAVLYKAYQTGELQEKFTVGIGIIVLSWLFWALVLFGYIILAKSQGRF